MPLAPRSRERMVRSHHISGPRGTMLIETHTVLITGASAGSLGAEVVRVLARDASLIVIAGRNQSKIARVKQDVLAETPTANIRSVIIDLASFASVRRAAAEVNAYEEPIHILINNAAMWEEKYTTTEDGNESVFQANYLSHFLLTDLLFNKIRMAKSDAFQPRIINVSSSMFAFSSARLDDLSWRGKDGKEDGAAYTGHESYGQSKTASILFSQELARRYGAEGILAYSVHPSGTWISSFLFELDESNIS